MPSETNMKYYIPWRAVWKQNSVSAPCRVVFDASQIKNTGYSLNDVIAKGRNNMNKLVEIVLRWWHIKLHFIQTYKKCTIQSSKDKRTGATRDTFGSKTLKDLEPSKVPDEKVIKTLIYGVRSSGNQAETGLRKTVDISRNLWSVK